MTPEQIRAMLLNPFDHPERQPGEVFLRNDTEKTSGDGCGLVRDGRVRCE